jgi:nitroimidazol reductase NimA-like FMN-containing flavoprotein (pyridoxamine 5'-phosphate oxidase superfamily)
MDQLARTPRTTLKRLPQRGSYERATIAGILDAGLVCHVGFAVDGAPFVIPTIYARIGDRLYFHGSAASRTLCALEGGVPACVTVTLIDGLVLARSAFHHSVNYRSVVVFGTAVAVLDPAEKAAALRAIVEHVVPQRWSHVREPNAQELKATLVLGLALDEASAKVRSGGPIDDEADLAAPVWAGQLPLELRGGAPIADARLAPGIAVPPHVIDYRVPSAR